MKICLSIGRFKILGKRRKGEEERGWMRERVKKRR
jgi:hypothetical protein